MRVLLEIVVHRGTHSTSTLAMDNGSKRDRAEYRGIDEVLKRSQALIDAHTSEIEICGRIELEKINWRGCLAALAIISSFLAGAIGELIDRDLELDTIDIDQGG